MKHFQNSQYSTNEVLKYITLVIFICFILIPVSFNFLVMWDSGIARGETSDWFTFYGNIVGGLIGGAFTYIALIKTFKKESENEEIQKKELINTKIKECILNNKTYLESLNNEFLLIQNTIVFDELLNVLEEFIDTNNYDFNNKNKQLSYQSRKIHAMFK